MVRQKNQGFLSGHSWGCKAGNLGKGFWGKGDWERWKQVSSGQILHPNWQTLCWRQLSSLLSLCSAFFLTGLLSPEISRQLFLCVLLETVLQTVPSCYSQNSLDSSSLSMFWLRQSSKCSSKNLLWIAHSCRSEAQSYILHINPVIYSGFLWFILWISIPWP